MQWAQVRQRYPDRWLIVEALEAHTDGNRRRLDQLAVVEECTDGPEAYRRYKALHHQFLDRELYFVHTEREQLEILERQWVGIRRSNAIESPR